MQIICYNYEINLICSNQIIHKMIKQAKENADLDHFKRDTDNDANAQNHTKRSMVTKQDNPYTILEQTIDDILALELSDTLMDTAYHLAAVKISISIHKVCDPLQKESCALKSWAFQNIKMYSNRLEAATFQQIKNRLQLQQNLVQTQQLKGTHYEKFQQVICLTKGQKITKLIKILTQRQKNLIRIINIKKHMCLVQAFARISQWSSKQEVIANKWAKNQIQQNFQRYQTRMRERLKKFQRRSIGKNQTKKSLNTSSFSLDKSQYKSQKLLNQAKTSQKIANKVSTRTGTLSSASKQSPNQQNNYKKTPEKGLIIRKTSPNLARKYLSQQLKSPQKFLNKVQTIQKDINTQDNSFSSSLVNSQNLQSVSKQKQLSYLRKKYYKLVQQFRQFSERFLKVIKQQ